MRQIILDTETTGRSTSEGHRIIEIGAIEMIDRDITGKEFHIYINPQRDIEAGAKAVHGIDETFLQDKPLFADIVDELIAFIDQSELIAHNAPFDVGFLDYEFSRLVGTQYAKQRIKNYCTVLDTLPLARKLHPGQRNSLDALCKRYQVNNAHRNLHGALIDADLLARVYLAMTGGQLSLFDEQALNPTTTQTDATAATAAIPRDLTVVFANEEELAAHQAYLSRLESQAEQVVWQQLSEKNQD